MIEAKRYRVLNLLDKTTIAMVMSRERNSDIRKRGRQKPPLADNRSGASELRAMLFLLASKVYAINKTLPSLGLS